MEPRRAIQSEIELVVDHLPHRPPPTISSFSSTNHHDDDDHNHHHHLRKLTLSSILSNFHAGYFRISLSLGGQALLWKANIVTDQPNASTDLNNHVLHVIPKSVVIVVWSFALLVLSILSLLYLLRCFFRFQMVKAEFLHHVGVNYLFAPSISWLLLLQSSPFNSSKSKSYLVFWWVFAIPVVILDVKIYGQWFTKGKRLLPAVANATSQMSVIGNLVGARAAAEMGWQETAVCLFSLGMVHYLVLFVTLYQRLSGSDRLPAMLRPVFFLFLAAPSMGSLAWDSISGTFDTASKMLFFLSLFLFASLICRPALFKKSMKRFNVAWWAYSFPMTLLALASTEYAQEVKGGFANALMFVLSALSVIIAVGLLIFTLLNSRMLLPDDDSILTIPDQQASRSA